MIRKLRLLWNKYVKYRGIQLTPKGEYFKSYCEQICNNSLQKTISSYEEFIDDLRLMIVEDYKMLLSREEVAEFILIIYREIT